MSNVIRLTQHRQPPLSAHAEFEAARRLMLASFLEWVKGQPDPETVRDEIDSTQSGIRQIAYLYGVHDGR